MLVRLKKLIRQCDIFGQPVALNIKSKNAHQSIFGGTISIFTVIFVALLLQRQFTMLLNKQNFFIQIQEVADLDPPQLNISQQNFAFAFAVSQGNQNRKFFDIKLQQKHVITKNNETETLSYDIELEPCTLEHFNQVDSQSIENEFQRRKIYNKFCPHLNNTFQLQGSYNSDLFSYLKISILPCTNDTGKCDTKEAIADFKKKNDFFSLTFSAITYQINPIAQKTYEQILFDDAYFTFLPGFYYSKADIFLRHVSITEDESIMPFYENFIKRDLIQIFDNEIRSSQVFNDQQNLHGEIYLRLSSKQQYITKSFMKIDEYLAYMGGILKIAIAIIGLLVINYNRYDLCLTIANRLFNFDFLGGDNQYQYESVNTKIKLLINKINTGQISPDELPKLEHLIQFVKSQSALQEDQLNDGFKLDNDEIEEIRLHQLKTQDTFLSYVINQLLQCKKLLAISFKYLFARLFYRYLFYEGDQDIYMIDTAIRTVKKELDVVNMIDKFQQLDQIKEILLNQWQILLFNYIPKPMLRPRNIKREKDRKQKEKQKIKDPEIFNIIQRTKGLYKAYDNLVRRSNNITDKEEEMNTKLVSFIDQDFTQILDFIRLLPRKNRKQSLNKKMRLIHSGNFDDIVLQDESKIHQAGNCDEVEQEPKVNAQYNFQMTKFIEPSFTLKEQKETSL